MALKAAAATTAATTRDSTTSTKARFGPVRPDRASAGKACPDDGAGDGAAAKPSSGIGGLAVLATGAPASGAAWSTVGARVGAGTAVVESERPNRRVGPATGLWMMDESTVGRVVAAGVAVPLPVDVAAVGAAVVPVTAGPGLTVSGVPPTAVVVAVVTPVEDGAAVVADVVAVLGDVVTVGLVVVVGAVVVVAVGLVSLGRSFGSVVGTAAAAPEVFVDTAANGRTSAMAKAPATVMQEPIDRRPLPVVVPPMSVVAVTHAVRSLARNLRGRI
ncbi:MAG TPA: hypothetical protein VHM89_07365 [Acidimicrobiales bacterium]|nr:hypothetical protein [Acidimicrobiales bacterium]